MKTLPKCDMTVSQKEELTVQLKHAQRTAMDDTANALESIIHQQKLLQVAEDAYSPLKKVTPKVRMLNLPTVLETRTEYVEAAEQTQANQSKILCYRFLADHPTLYREGDRVMQIRNNYDIMWKKQDGSAVGAGIFNGDIGTVTAIDPQMETLTVIFDDKEADYDFSQLNELEPAYAMTVHKSQGSEYRAVVLAAWNGSAYLLSRSILYTAITRARELLIIVGREETVAVMTQNAKKNRRYSGLKLRLQGKCA